VEVNLGMRVPKNQEIKYSPAFLEKTVELWTQFVALLIPVYFVVVYLLLGTAFEKKVISSKEWSEVKQARGEYKRGINHRYDF